MLKAEKPTPKHPSHYTILVLNPMVTWRFPISKNAHIMPQFLGPVAFHRTAISFEAVLKASGVARP
jgi:hypothetical protein